MLKVNNKDPRTTSFLLFKQCQFKFKCKFVQNINQLNLYGLSQKNGKLVNSTFQSQTSKRYDDVTALSWNFRLTETVFRTCSVKKVFFKIPQNSQENTCAGVSF